MPVIFAAAAPVASPRNPQVELKRILGTAQAQTRRERAVQLFYTLYSAYTVGGGTYSAYKIVSDKSLTPGERQRKVEALLISYVDQTASNILQVEKEKGNVSDKDYDGELTRYVAAFVASHPSLVVEYKDPPGELPSALLGSVTRS